MKQLSSHISYPKRFWNKYRISLILLALCVFFSPLFSSLIMGGALLFFLLYVVNGNTSIDGESFLLILAFFSFGSILIYQGQTVLWASYYSVTSILMFFIGRYYLSNYYHEDILLLLLFFIAIVLAAPHIFVTIEDIYKFGLINPTRELKIFGDETIGRAITQRTIELSLCTLGFTMFFYMPEDKFQRRIRNCFIVIAVLSLLCFVHYVSRTGIAITLMALSVGLFFSGTSRGNYRSVIALLLLLVTIVVLAHNQLSGIFDIYAAREIEGSSISNAGGRTGQWKEVFISIFAYPLGHSSSTFAHNMWLDIGKVAGIIPFSLLALFSLSSLIRSFKIAKNRCYPRLIRMLVLSCSLCFLLSCYTECIHEGAPLYMFFYCMFCGMVNYVYHHPKVQSR